MKPVYFSSWWHLGAMAAIAACVDGDDTLQGLKGNLLNLSWWLFATHFICNCL